MRITGLNIRALMGVILMAVSSHSAAGPQEEINAHCAGKWETDYSMQKYCRGNQTTAHNALVDMQKQNPENSAFSAILSRCGQKWSPDREMWKYCTDNQLEAVSKAADLVKQFEGDSEVARIMANCMQKWLPEGDKDYEMFVYCSENQIQAYKSLQ